MNRTLFFLAAFMLGDACLIASETEQARQAPCRKIGADGCVGLINETGEVVRPPMYPYCGQWHEGRLWVRESAEDRFQGRFIDSQGNVLPTGPLGDLADVFFEWPDPEFRNGVAWVSVHPGEYALIRADGMYLGETTPRLALGCWAHGPGPYAVARDGRYGFVDRTGAFIIPPRFEDVAPFQWNMALVKDEGKWGAIDTCGNYVVPPVYDALEQFPNESKFLKFMRKNRWGLLATNGHEVLPPDYIGIGWCQNGLVVAETEKGNVLIEISGDDINVHPERYEEIGGMGCGCVLAKSGGKWGVVARNGEQRIPLRFDSVSGFGEDGFCLVRENGLVGMIDAEGKILCEPVYSHIRGPRDGYFVVQQGHRWGLLNVESKGWLAPEYEQIKMVGGFKDHAAIMKKGAAWGVLDVEQNSWVVPCDYAEIIRWNNLFAAQRDGVIRLFDREGMEVLDESVEITALPNPEEMKFGYGTVKARSGSGIISASGELVLPPLFEDAGIPSENMIPVKKDGAWGYADWDGTMVIAPEYTRAAAFHDGLAGVEKDGKFGLIDPVGHWIIQPIYAAVGYYAHGRIPVAMKGNGANTLKWGLIDVNGKCILPMEYDCLEWDDIESGQIRLYGQKCRQR